MSIRGALPLTWSIRSLAMSRSGLQFCVAVARSWAARTTTTSAVVATHVMRETRPSVSTGSGGCNDCAFTSRAGPQRFTGLACREGLRLPAQFGGRSSAQANPRSPRIRVVKCETRSSTSSAAAGQMASSRADSEPAQRFDQAAIAWAGLIPCRVVNNGEAVIRATVTVRRSADSTKAHQRKGGRGSRVSVSGRMLGSLAR